MSEEKREAESGRNFVMPESDGIRNGYPLDEEEKEEMGEGIDLTPEGYNRRVREAVSSAGGGEGGQTAAANILGAGGITIKAKLIASLSLLTLIILVLGVISFTSIVEINTLSVSIADRQSALAKITEEIKS